MSTQAAYEPQDRPSALCWCAQGKGNLSLLPVLTCKGGSLHVVPYSYPTLPLPYSPPTARKKQPPSPSGSEEGTSLSLGQRGAG